MYWGIQRCIPWFWCLMRYLIRLARSKFDDWVNGQGAANPQKLTDSVFRPTKAHRPEFKDLLEDSTYLVARPIEEARVAAAHLLAGNSPTMETRYLIRVLVSDAEEVGLRVDDGSIGKTGVPWIDFRHRDLVGTRDQFRQLVEGILGRIREGENRVRRIGAVQDEFSFNEFLARPTSEIPTCTRDLITCVLNKTPIAALNPNVVLALAEMAALAIPKETVSLRAFCLEEAGQGTGSPEGNWELAMNQLRDEYKRKYPHMQLGQ
jgi:hypothetical protein